MFQKMVGQYFPERHTFECQELNISDYFSTGPQKSIVRPLIKKEAPDPKELINYSLFPLKALIRVVNDIQRAIDDQCE